MLVILQSSSLVEDLVLIRLGLSPYRQSHAAGDNAHSIWKVGDYCKVKIQFCGDIRRLVNQVCLKRIVARCFYGGKLVRTLGCELR